MQLVTCPAQTDSRRCLLILAVCVLLLLRVLSGGLRQAAVRLPTAAAAVRWNARVLMAACMAYWMSRLPPVAVVGPVRLAPPDQLPVNSGYAGPAQDSKQNHAATNVSKASMRNLRQRYEPSKEHSSLQLIMHSCRTHCLDVA